MDIPKDYKKWIVENLIKLNNIIKEFCKENIISNEEWLKYGSEHSFVKDKNKKIYKYKDIEIVRIQFIFSELQVECKIQRLN